MAKPRGKARMRLGMIGVGAFGGFMVPHLSRHFQLVLHDPGRDLSRLRRRGGVAIGSLAEAAACEVVLLAVPVQALEAVLRQIAPQLAPGTLVVDVASVKLKPAALMRRLLPRGVNVVGTHPLFGPQSGRNGIRGLNIVVCDVRGRRAACVSRYCRALGLRVFRATPREHDRELAYVQGLTHLLARIVAGLELPPLRFTTKAFDHMMTMIGMLRHDSDELFRAIERENPYSAGAKRAFFASARRLEQRLLSNVK